MSSVPFGLVNQPDRLDPGDNGFQQLAIRCRIVAALHQEIVEHGRLAFRGRSNSAVSTLLGL